MFSYTIQYHVSGFVLNTEIVQMRQQYAYDKQIIIDPDCTAWVEDGGTGRVYVNTIRIFYIHNNKPEFVTLGKLRILQFN